MKTFEIAVIPGDGIGQEVIAAGIEVLEGVGASFGFTFRWQTYPWGCEYYTRTGRMMPEDRLEQLRPTPSFWGRWAIRACLIMCRCGAC